MQTRSAYEVINFITERTSVKAFYDYVTYEETNFEYDINAHGRSHWTALHAACYKGNVKLIQALINMGANINAYSDWGHPLSVAIQKGHLDVVKLLIKSGAYFNEYWIGEDRNQNSYIKLAQNYKQSEIEKYLINQTPNSLKTLLLNKLRHSSEFYELSQKKFKAQYPKETIPPYCIELIEKGTVECRLRWDQITGVTSIILKAVENNNLDELALLLNEYKYYIDISLKVDTPIAINHGNLKMVKLLVENGGLISGIEDALRQEHIEIVDYLREVQRDRYQRLREEVRQERNTTFLLGFFDNDSVLNQEIRQKAGEQVTANIVNKILSY